MSDRLLASGMIAAASDINEELVIVSSAIFELIEATDRSDPLFDLMCDIQAAATRLGWKAGSLLKFGQMHGGQATPMPMELVMVKSASLGVQGEKVKA